MCLFVLLFGPWWFGLFGSGSYPLIRLFEFIEGDLCLSARIAPVPVPKKNGKGRERPLCQRLDLLAGALNRLRPLSQLDLQCLLHPSLPLGHQSAFPLSAWPASWSCSPELLASSPVGSSSPLGKVTATTVFSVDGSKACVGKLAASSSSLLTETGWSLSSALLCRWPELLVLSETAPPATKSTHSAATLVQGGGEWRSWPC